MCFGGGGGKTPKQPTSTRFEPRSDLDNQNQNRLRQGSSYEQPSQATSLSAASVPTSSQPIQ